MLGVVVIASIHISIVVSELCSTDKNMPALLKTHSSRVYNDENRIELGVQEKILERAGQLKHDLDQGVSKPFKDIIDANVGDSSVFGDNQITFIRQVTALACLPDLLLDSSFPDDVKYRVRTLLQHCQGYSIGSLTDIEGLEMVRRHIAGHISQRDSCPANWEDIIIVPGISAAVKILYKLMNYTLHEEAVGVLTPVPEFPLFTKALNQFGIENVGYYLSEDNHWSVDVADLEQAVLERAPNCCLRAILIINPGNPTGYAGESGMRAGYMELYNINSSVKELLRTSIQIADSPPICAQIALDCMANPPSPGQPSYSLFQQERTYSLRSMKERARLVYDAINNIPGLSSHFVQGGFFAFIKVDIPGPAVDKANWLNQCPSTFYSLELLEHTGVVTFPGGQFGQKPGSHHFRISILLPEEVLKEALQRIQDFHLNFTNQYN